MSQNDEKLKTLPKELFQLDQPDLVFGRSRRSSRPPIHMWPGST
jgi:hypothetical protein